MGELTVKACELEPGDVLVDPSLPPSAAPPRLVVAGVQSLGALVIVDFADSTSTPPMPSSVLVAVRRPG